MQQLLNLGEGEGLKKAQPKHGRAGRTRPYAVADVHEWRERSTGKIFRLTIGQMMQREQCAYTTVKAWIDGVARRSVVLPKSKASKAALALGERLRKYDWLRKLGRTVDGDFFAWLQSKPVKGGGGRVIQPAGKRTSKAADGIVIIMARYQSGSGAYRSGTGVKSLAAEYGVGQPTLTTMLREGGIDTSLRANYATSGRCNRIRLREWNQAKMKEPEHRVKKRVMSRIQSAMKRQSVNTRGSFRYVGCCAERLRAHIESQFSEGMGWHNYGKWHIDHIKPCALFDLSRKDEAMKCFHWTNLQPLWATDNLRKGAKYAARAA
jgi:hypothetical protein